MRFLISAARSQSAHVKRRAAQFLRQGQPAGPHVGHKDLAIEPFDVAEILNEQQSAGTGAGDQDVPDAMPPSKS